MSCSLIFSGISSLSGRLRNFPIISEPSHSSQLEEPALLLSRESVITTRDLDFSRTPTTSPGFRVYEGILTISPFTVICLWLTSWRAASRLGATPSLYTTLSRRDSSSCNSTSPVTPLLLELSQTDYGTAFQECHRYIWLSVFL